MWDLLAHALLAHTCLALAGSGQWHAITLLESFLQKEKVSVSSFIASFPSFHFSQCHLSPVTESSGAQQ